MMSTDNYIIRETRPEEQLELAEFLGQHFAPYVQPNARYYKEIAHKMSEAEKAIIVANRSQKFEKVLRAHLSYVAVHKETNKIAGISLMAVKRNPKFHETTVIVCNVLKYNFTSTRKYENHFF